MDDVSSTSSGRFNEALQMLVDWLANAEAYLVEDQPVFGDLDTVNILVEKHKVFQQEFISRRDMMNSLLSTPGLDPGIRIQLHEMLSVWDRIQELSDLREAKLNESFQLAEQFNDAIEVVRNWLPDAEAELKFLSIPEDEDSIMQQLENHERFEEELRAQQVNIDKIRLLAEEILQACHPNAVRFIKYYVTITQTRWEQALSRSSQRGAKLQETLRTVRTNAAHVEELMIWLADCLALLQAKEKDSIPDDLTVVEELVKEHREFEDEMLNRKEEVERLIRSLPAVSSASKKSPRTPGRPSDAHENSSPAPGAIALQRKWYAVLKMSSDRSVKLHEVHERLLELESIKNFDFDDWRKRYVAWTRQNKLKYTDFFRRYDKEGTGMLTRKQFIDGMLASKFPTSTAELGAVFNLFDGNKTGRIEYKLFADNVMRSDKQFTGQKPTSGRQVSEAEMIFTAVEDQVSQCHCHSHFAMMRIDDNRYKFGEKDKIYQLKLLNGSVYVRFGASWMPLEELLATIDPCRPKNDRKIGLSSRFSGSTSNLSFIGKSSASPRSGLGSGLAGQKNGLLAKSWSNLSTPSKSPMSLSPSVGNQNSLRQLTFSTPTSTSYSTASLGRPQSARRTQPSSNYPVSPPPSVGTSSLFSSSSTSAASTRHHNNTPRAGTRPSLSSSSSSSSQFGDISTPRGSTGRNHASSSLAVNGRAPTSSSMKSMSLAHTAGESKTTAGVTPGHSSTLNGRSTIGYGDHYPVKGGSRPGSASSRTNSPGPSKQASQLGSSRLYIGLQDHF